MKNSNCRASPVGIGSDTPSFWNLQSNFLKRELLQKPGNLYKFVYDLGTEILYETCFVNNSTQKASPEELQVRIFTKSKFVKIRTYSSSVASEFNTEKQLLPTNCMRPWIRSLSLISLKRALREYLMIPFIKYVHWTHFL